MVLLAASAVGRLCRDKLCALVLGNDLETPSDIHGVSS